MDNLTALASWGLEKNEKWHALPKQAKSIIILIITALLGAGAAYLKTQPELVALADPYVKPVLYAALAWLASQSGHKIIKSNSRSE